MVFTWSPSRSWAISVEHVRDAELVDAVERVIAILSIPIVALGAEVI